MTRHLADKRAPSTGGRIKHFLRIAQDNSDRLWHVLWRAPRPVPAHARRTVEFLRIDRGRQG